MTSRLHPKNRLCKLTGRCAWLWLLSAAGVLITAVYSLQKLKEHEDIDAGLKKSTLQQHGARSCTRC